MKRSRAASGLAVLLLFAACRMRDASPAARTNAGGTTPPPSPVVLPAGGSLDESRDATPVDGGVLRQRLLGEPASLNAILQSSVFEAQVLQFIQRNLFDFDAQMNLVPGLAEGYQVSPDGREYTVTVRGDVVWEDGRPVTARDAVFTIRKIVDPKIPASVFKPLFEDLESIESVDDRRFRARFREPYAFRPMAFAVPVLPEHRFARLDFLKARDNRAPLSNGPYRILSWKAQESIELERNPAYRGPRGHFDRIVFRILSDNTTAYRLLSSGELDEDPLEPALKARAAGDAAFQSCCRLVEFYNLDYSYISLNNRSPLFQDARVRRALTMLLDRAAIVASLFRGSAREISGPWAPDSAAYDASLEPLPFDPAAAARLLEEAGWRDSNGNGVRDRGGREFEFDLFVSEGSEIGKQIDEMLSAELSRVGITARVRTMEWAAFVERLDAGEFDAASLAWSAVDPNPDPFFYWHSSQCAPKGLNSGCYNNPEADRLMVEARREMDAGRRTDLLHRLHRIFRDDAPAIFVANATQRFGFDRRIRGLTTSPLGLFGIWPGPLGWWAQPPAGERGAAPARSPEVPAAQRPAA